MPDPIVPSKNRPVYTQCMEIDSVPYGVRDKQKKNLRFFLSLFISGTGTYLELLSSKFKRKCQQ